MVLYSKGLSESFKNICGKARVQVHFKGANTVKQLLVVPKDKDSIYNEGGVIYRYKCDQPGCTMEYIGDTGRNFSKKYKEHLRPPSLTIPKLQDTTVGREPQGITRTIKEALHIRVNEPVFKQKPGQS